MTLLPLYPELEIDQLLRRWGWRLENAATLPMVQQAIQRGEPVAVYQTAGRHDWWQVLGTWPHGFERLAAWPTEVRWQALIAISDHLLPEPPAKLAKRMLVLRPPTLTLGIGCGRGIQMEDLSAAIRAVLAAHGLAELSLTAVASSNRRKTEAGVQEFAEERQLPYLTYAVDKLRLTLPRGQTHVGVAATCEPAAMLAAGVRELIVPKTIVGRIAIAVARRPMANGKP